MSWALNYVKDVFSSGDASREEIEEAYRLQDSLCGEEKAELQRWQQEQMENAVAEEFASGNARVATPEECFLDDGAEED